MGHQAIDFLWEKPSHIGCIVLLLCFQFIVFRALIFNHSYFHHHNVKLFIAHFPFW